VKRHLLASDADAQQFSWPIQNRANEMIIGLPYATHPISLRSSFHLLGITLVLCQLNVPGQSPGQRGTQPPPRVKTGRAAPGRNGACRAGALDSPSPTANSVSSIKRPDRVPAVFAFHQAAIAALWDALRTTSRGGSRKAAAAIKLESNHYGTALLRCSHSSRSSAKVLATFVILYLLIGVRYIPHRRVSASSKTVVPARFAWARAASSP